MTWLAWPGVPAVDLATGLAKGVGLDVVPTDLAIVFWCAAFLVTPLLAVVVFCGG